MSLFKKIAIVGGFGDLGKHVTAAILAEGDRFDLTLITRKSGQIQAPVGAKVVELDDYSDSDELIEALTGQDVLMSFHNIGAAPGANLSLLSCAIKAGIKRFVPSDYSFDVTHPAAIEQAVPGSPMAGRTATTNRIFSAASKGDITYTLFVPAGWLDWGLDNGFLGFDIKARKARLVDQGAHKATACTQPFIAQSVVKMLKQPPNETENKKIPIAEVEYTGLELLKLFEEETGAKWEVTNITLPELLEIAEKAKAANDIRLRVVSITHFINFGGFGATYFPEALSTSLEGSPYQRKSLKQIVRDAVQRMESS